MPGDRRTCLDTAGKKSPVHNTNGSTSKLCSVGIHSKLRSAVFVAGRWWKLKSIHMRPTIISATATLFYTPLENISGTPSGSFLHFVVSAHISSINLLTTSSNAFKRVIFTNWEFFIMQMPLLLSSWWSPSFGCMWIGLNRPWKVPVNTIMNLQVRKRHDISWPAERL
jgi:hypothetical protein